MDIRRHYQDNNNVHTHISTELDRGRGEPLDE